MKQLTVKERNKLNGILGTVIFHLLLVLMFFGIKLHKLNVPEQDAFLLDFSEEEQFEPLEEINREINELKNNLPTTDISETQKSNIAASIDREFSKEVSTDEYLQELMDELNINDLNPEHNTDLPSELTNPQDKVKQNGEVHEHNRLTRINYKLGKRKKLKIPQPLFMCEGGGLVIIDITVDQNGYVSTAVLSPESESSDECLVREALTAARKSVFTKSPEGLKKENGFISFEFVAQ